MSNAEFLLYATLIQQGLLGLGWLGLMALQLARVPSVHWAIASGLVAAALGLASLRLSGGNPWWSYFAANSLALLAYLVARRGLQVFCDRPRTDREHVVVFIVYLLGLLPLVADGTREWLLVGWTSAFTGYLLLRMGAEGIASLRLEFGQATALVCLLPAMVIGVMFTLRALAAPLLSAQVGHSLTQPGAFNARFALALMAATFLLNIGLVSLVVVRTVRQLQRLSDHDALTGVLNRRGFEGVLARERDRLQRGGPGFALLSLDIDHFKRINDRHGHARGDAALVAVAQVLRAGARRTDEIARMGGEEFMVLLPGVDHDAAELAARRLLDAVRLEAHRHAALPEPLTVSIGVVASADGDEALDSLLHRVDEKLYSAKAGGRDRVAGTVRVPAHAA